MFHYNRGYGYGVSGVSGVITAGLAIDSIVLALRCDSQVGVAKPVAMVVDRLHLAFTAIAAFTTPVTAARRLAIYRASGVAATGGTALAVVRKNLDGALAPASVCTDARISTTAALTVAGIVRESAPIGTMDLTHVGAAGARQDFLFELAAPANHPIVLNAGELLVVSNPVAMDAGGTWQLTVKEAHWIEARREETWSA